MSAFFSVPPRRILLVCTQRIGDVLLMTPLLRSLRRAWPAARLEVLVLPGTEGVLAGNPDVDEVLARIMKTAENAVTGEKVAFKNVDLRVAGKIEPCSKSLHAWRNLKK